MKIRKIQMKNLLKLPNIEQHNPLTLVMEDLSIHLVFHVPIP